MKETKRLIYQVINIFAMLEKALIYYSYFKKLVMNKAFFSRIIVMIMISQLFSIVSSYASNTVVVVDVILGILNISKQNIVFCIVDSSGILSILHIGDQDVILSFVDCRVVHCDVLHNRRGLGRLSYSVLCC